MSSNTIKITIEYNGNASVYEMPFVAEPIATHKMPLVTDVASTENTKKMFNTTPINDTVIEMPISADNQSQLKMQLVSDTSTVNTKRIFNITSMFNTTHINDQPDETLRKDMIDFFIHSCVTDNIDAVQLLAPKLDQSILKDGYNKACLNYNACVLKYLCKYIKDIDAFSTNLLLAYYKAGNTNVATFLITHVVPKEIIVKLLQNETVKLLQDETICSSARNDLRAAYIVVWRYTFKQACILGNIERAKTLYIKGLGDSFPNLMRDVCEAGKFEVAMWLSSHGYKFTV